MYSVHALHYTFSGPLQWLVTTLWITWYYNMNQGILIFNQRTLLDLHRPTNGPWRWPCKTCFWGSLLINALQGPYKVHIGQYIYIDLWTSDKLKNTAWFEFDRTIGSRDIIIYIILICWRLVGPRLIRVKIQQLTTLCLCLRKMKRDGKQEVKTNNSIYIKHN